MEADVTRLSLLSRVRNGSDQAAWAEFESRYRELIVRYALGRGVQYADADDISQIVMMSLASSLRSFQYAPQRGRFRDYLGRIVRNAVARYRSRPKAAPLSLDDVEDGTEPGDEAARDSAWEQEWVNHHYRLAMQTVRQSFDARSVEIFERLLEGVSVADLAVTYATTEPAVHKVKQRIRDRMAELIQAQVRDEDDSGEPETD